MVNKALLARKCALWTIKHTFPFDLTHAKFYKKLYYTLQQCSCISPLFSLLFWCVQPSPITFIVLFDNLLHTYNVTYIFYQLSRVWIRDLLNCGNQAFNILSTDVVKCGLSKNGKPLPPWQMDIAISMPMLWNFFSYIIIQIVKYNGTNKINQILV